MQLFKIEASSFFVKLKLVLPGLPHGLHIQVYILQDQHRGHGLEVGQVFHVVTHAKDVLHMAHLQDQAKVGNKSGNNRKQCIQITLL
jgi:hypothetical protein